MKIKYDTTADALYITLKKGRIARTKEAGAYLEPISEIPPAAIRTNLWSSQGARTKVYPSILRVRSDTATPKIRRIPKGCEYFPVSLRCSSVAVHSAQLPRQALRIRENLPQRGQKVFLRWVLVDYDKKGGLLGFEVLNYSKKVPAPERKSVFIGGQKRIPLPA